MLRDFDTNIDMNGISTFINTIPPYLKTTAGIYLTWIIFHYIATHLYSNYCNNWSIYGFIFSPLTNSTPFCKGLLYIISNGSANISQMWTLLGSWIAGYLIIPK
jgi:hypothetical protein